MQGVLFEILAPLSLLLGSYGVVGIWKRLTKNVEHGPIQVTRKDDASKSVTLPENYSPAAVRALRELAA